jgi:alpha-galactosidase
MNIQKLQLSVFLLILINCPNLLCQKPYMGFNSYDSYSVYLNQETARKLIDVMAEKYLPSGYEYFVIDYGWYTEYVIDPKTKLPIKSSGTHYNLDRYGLPEPSKIYFSEGIKFLADYAHKKGLKIGLHLMRGALKQAIKEKCTVKGTSIPIKDIVDTMSICTWSSMSYGVDMSRQGAYEYYKSLIDKLASWGIDFIKFDDLTGMPKEIDAIVKAIKSNGKQIVLSLSPGEDTKLEYLPYYEKCNILRVTSDVWDNQRSIDNGFTAMKIFQGRGFSGFWPDLDMISLGPLEVNDPAGKLGTGRGKRMSMLDKDQAYTFITQRAIFASPLIIGGDMLTMDDFTYKLLTNKDMISCNQNSVTGFLTYDKDSILVFNTPARDNPSRGWIAVFNCRDRSNTVSLKKSDFGFFFNRPELQVLLKDYQLRDIWNQKEYSLKNSLQLTIPGHGVMFAEYNENK